MIKQDVSEMSIDRLQSFDSPPFPNLRIVGSYKCATQPETCYKVETCGGDSIQFQEYQCAVNVIG